MQVVGVSKIWEEYSKKNMDFYDALVDRVKTHLTNADEIDKISKCMVLKTRSYSEPSDPQVIEAYDWKKPIQRLVGVLSVTSPFSRLRKFDDDTKRCKVSNEELDDMEIDISLDDAFSIIVSFLNGIPRTGNKKIYDRLTSKHFKFTVKNTDLDQSLICVLEGLSSTTMNCSLIAGRIHISNYYHQIASSFTENIDIHTRLYKRLNELMEDYCAKNKMSYEILEKSVYAYDHPISDSVLHACKHIGKEIDAMIQMQRDYSFELTSARFETSLYALNTYTLNTCGQCIVLDRDMFHDGIKKACTPFQWLSINNDIEKRIKNSELGKSTISESFAMETFQYTAMREALQLGYTPADPEASVERIRSIYDTLTLKMGTFGSPVTFNAGTKRPQMASCYVESCRDRDSLDGIYESYALCAKYSKSGGGVGISVNNIRPKGAPIRNGGNGGGVSPGLIPMIKQFDGTANYVSQSSGKRKGNYAITLELSHPEILNFLAMKDNIGKEHERAKDLFYAVNIRDIFMERLRARKGFADNSRHRHNASIPYFSLICPYKFPHLYTLYGDEFKEEYERIEKQYGSLLIKIDPVVLWRRLCLALERNSMPYCIFIDTVNKHLNYNDIFDCENVNLCAEITQRGESMCFVCTLGAPTFIKKVRDGGYKRQYKINRCGKEILKYVDWEKLASATRVMYCSIRTACERSWYPTKGLRKNTLDDGNTGVGLQGFDDVLYALEVAPGSEEESLLNFHFFDTIYYNCLAESVAMSQEAYAMAIKEGNRQDELEVAKKNGIEGGLPHRTFYGTHFSHGRFQFDLWGKTDEVESRSSWDWKGLRKKVQKHGTVSILLTAQPPTASKSSYLGFSEACERSTAPVYMKRTLSGDTVIANAYLMKDLRHWGIMSSNNMKEIIGNDCTVNGLDWVPNYMKELYATAWEISQKISIDLSHVRGWFLDQSESGNRFLADPHYGSISSMLMYAHGKVKTGIYYLRRKPASDSQKISVNLKTINKNSKKNETISIEIDNDKLHSRVNDKKQKGSAMVINISNSEIGTISIDDKISSTSSSSPETPFTPSINGLSSPNRSEEGGGEQNTIGSYENSSFVKRMQKKLSESQDYQPDNNGLDIKGCVWCE